MAEPVVIARATRVASKTELSALLDGWYRSSVESDTTIGDGSTYGGVAWIHVDLPSGHAVLNGDTTRDAVRSYLEDVRRRGPEATWCVVANARGRINKVLYTPERRRLPGWYCYLETPLTAERVL